MPCLRRFLFISLLVFLPLLLNACNAATPATTEASEAVLPSMTPAVPATQLPTPRPTQPPTATPTPAPAPRTQYTLDVLFDYDNHQLLVDEVILYTNTSGETLSEMVLMIDPLYYPGAFQLTRLEYEDGKPVAEPRQETGWLRFPLELPLYPGKAIGLSLSYQLNLPSPSPSPSIRPIPFGYTARQTNLVDWYPFIPPYQAGQGWLAHSAGYYGEHLVYDSADFYVNLRTATPQPNLIFAASSTPTQDGEWLRYQHLNARNFAWSASPYYQTLTAQAGAVQVTAYAFSGQETANQAVLDTTVEALKLYASLFGPYPRQSLNVIEADFLDGMEYDGLYFLSKGFYNLYTGNPAEYLVTIAAHETAHQWFYALVGNDQALEPWLDEALCTYSEKLFYENLHPEALDWWWTYRINYYQPRGWVDSSIYNPHGESEPYRAYRDAVYLNGAVFLDELRQTVGEEAFLAFLRSYIEQKAYQIASKVDFFSILEDYTAIDLTPLIEKYFYLY